MKKKSHGGKRKGAGAPKKEPTVVMRIPISKVAAVKKIIAPKEKRQRSPKPLPPSKP